LLFPDKAIQRAPNRRACYRHEARSADNNLVAACPAIAKELRAMAETSGLEINHAANIWPPPGFIERDEVARLCGVIPSTIKVWARQGRLAGGRLAKKPGSRVRIAVYPEANARKLIEDVRAEVEAPFPPEGFLDRYQAAAMFKMHVSQFVLWQRLGRIRCATRTVRGPSGGPAKIYAITDLERSAQQLAAEDSSARKPPV
jgi:hypothetical protein